MYLLSYGVAELCACVFVYLWICGFVHLCNWVFVYICNGCVVDLLICVFVVL